MKEVIIGRTPHGFKIPQEIVEEFYKLNSCDSFYDLFPSDYFDDWDISLCLITVKDGDTLKILSTSNRDVREHKDLIALIRKHQATLPHLKIVEIPEDVEYDIVENDYGIEFIAEKHRIWY